MKSSVFFSLDIALTGIALSEGGGLRGEEAATPSSETSVLKGTAAKPTAEEPPVSLALLPQDLSPWGMFLHADTIVKAVMIGLAVASLVTWTVWVAKSIELFGARAAVRRGLRILASSVKAAMIGLC